MSCDCALQNFQCQANQNKVLPVTGEPRTHYKERNVYLYTESWMKKSKLLWKTILAYFLKFKYGLLSKL